MRVPCTNGATGLDHGPRCLARRELLFTAIAAGLQLPGGPAAAEDPPSLATAYFSAGDARFLQPVFDEAKYMGIKTTEVGVLGATPAIRITYNPAKVSYKRILGVFWRACDPTSTEQFGDPGPTVIWAASEEEQSMASESRRRLQKSTEYSSATFGPMYQGRPVLTEIRPLAGEWEPAPEADQEWYKKEEKSYEKLRKKTGRSKWFSDAFKPVTVTACQKQDGGKGAGTVCGFVYFPCSEENGCSAVTKGSF